MKDFKSLKVWEKSHSFTLKVYKLSLIFPKDELYGLTSQVRRSASSIPTNIAEGCGRGSDADFARFLQMAFGSASETEYILLLVKDLNYISENDYDNLFQDITEIKKMLATFIIKLKNNF